MKKKLTIVRILTVIMTLILLFTCSLTAFAAAPANDEPVMPTITDEGEAATVPYPGQPVYVDNPEWLKQQREREQFEKENPDAPPEPATLERLAHVVFDHYDDPPPAGTVRLVHNYNYGETATVLVRDAAKVAEILRIADSLKVSKYNGGGIMGGEAVEIQAVRGGVHQNYSIITNDDYQNASIATNGRDPVTWYETSMENSQRLLSFFVGMPHLIEKDKTLIKYAVERYLREIEKDAGENPKDIEFRKIAVSLSPDQQRAAANVVYWHTWKEIPKDERWLTRKKNIIYESWTLEKKNGDWVLAGLTDQYTEEDRQRDLAYAPAEALYGHLTSTLSDDAQGGIVKVDLTDYEKVDSADDSFPFKYQLLVWTVDAAAVRAAIAGYKGAPVDVVLKKAKYSVNELLGFADELNKSTIGPYISVGLELENNRLLVASNSTQHLQKVESYLASYHAKDAVGPIGAASFAPPANT